MCKESEKVKIETFPKVLHIEITTMCNARCVICPRKCIKRKNKSMSLDDILDIVQQGWDMGIREVHPHLLGEPALHPQFVELLYALHKRFVGIHIVSYTNGSRLMDPQIRKAYLDTCGRVTISMDGARSSVMRKTRPGVNPFIVRKGVKLLINERGSNLSPQIFARMTVMPDTENDKELFNRVWQCCDGISFLPLIRFEKDTNVTSSLNQRQYTEAIHHMCDRLFTSITISVEKKVILCCCDYNASVVLGDLNKQSLSDIWNGDVITSIRDRHQKGKACEIPLCATCGYFNFV